jgi:hypothetical protein
MCIRDSAMTVHAEALAGLHHVVVDHPQGTEAHVPGVVVLAEREGVPGVEPAVVEVAAFPGGTPRDHDLGSFRRAATVPPPSDARAFSPVEGKYMIQHLLLQQSFGGAGLVPRPPADDIERRARTATDRTA